MTLNDLDLEYAHRKLKSVLDTTHVAVLAYSHFIRPYSVRQNHVHQIVKHFEFDVTFDVIGDPEVNNTRCPAINFPDLSNAV